MPRQGQNPKDRVSSTSEAKEASIMALGCRVLWLNLRGRAAIFFYFPVLAGMLSSARSTRYPGVNFVFQGPVQTHALVPSAFSNLANTDAYKRVSKKHIFVGGPSRSIWPTFQIFSISFPFRSTPTNSDSFRLSPNSLVLVTTYLTRLEYLKLLPHQDHFFHEPY